MENNNKNLNIKPIPFWLSFVIFFIPTILLFFATHFGIEFISKKFNVLPQISWFINGSVLIFIPLFTFAIFLFKLENNNISFNILKKRFRIYTLTKEDWFWTIGCIVFISVTSGLILFIANLLSDITGLFEHLKTSPLFFEFEPLTKNQLWVLIIWLPFFFLNIVGEELLWRGYLLPRQELTHNKSAWIVNGLLWGMLHISFGWNLILILLPILFSIPYVVQKRRNTLIGMIVHATINGAGFILVSLGLVK
jgi:membrane protease YdiL (CAAX protease family)